VRSSTSALELQTHKKILKGVKIIMSKTNTTIGFHPEHSEERNDFPFDLPYVVDHSTNRRYVRAERLYKYILGVDMLDTANQTPPLKNDFTKWIKSLIGWHRLERGSDYIEGGTVYFHLPTAWYLLIREAEPPQRKEILSYLSACEETIWDDDLEDDFYGDDDDPYEDYIHRYEDEEATDDEAVGEEEQKYRALIDAKLDELIDHMDELEDRTASLETKLCNIRISMSE
jgi:hypothetical protein